MFWKNIKIPSWFKTGKHKGRPVLAVDFDKKLLKKVHNNTIPNWTQLKYFSFFLEKKERLVIQICTIIICTTLLVWGSYTAIRHINTMPKAGGEYSEAIVGHPKLINPLFSSINDVDADLVSLVYSGLFRYDNNLKLTPDLAESYTTDANKKIYDIVLKKNVQWTDGEPFGANDVMFTFETIQNPDVGSPLLPAFQGIIIQKIDDHTVRFILKDTFAPFLNTLTTGILPEHIWSNINANNVRLAKNNLEPIGTGPWKFAKLVKDESGNIQSYTLERNEKYFASKAYLKNITFKFFNEYNDATDNLRSNNVSALSFVPRNYQDKISKANFNIYNLQLPQYTALFFNDTREVALKNDNLRLALATAIDKKTIIKEALGENGEIINSPILRGYLGYYPEIKKINFNLDEADALLDKNWTRIPPEEYFKLQKTNLLKNRQAEIDAVTKNASSTQGVVSSTIENINKEIDIQIRQGMTVEQPFYRRDKNNGVLTLVITTVDTVEYAKAAETIAKMWNKIGIQTTVEKISNRQITKEILKDRNYQILLYGEIIGSDPDPYAFWHSSQTEYPGLNLSMYSNRTIDKILEDARTATDDKEREKLYKQFQDALVKDLPVVFLYSPSYTFAIQKDIRGVLINRIYSPADRFNDIGRWYTKTKWIWK